MPDSRGRGCGRFRVSRKCTRMAWTPRSWICRRYREHDKSGCSPLTSNGRTVAAGGCVVADGVGVRCSRRSVLRLRLKSGDSGGSQVAKQSACGGRRRSRFLAERDDARLGYSHLR